MPKLSHTDAQNNPAMVNISEKSASHRIAVARSELWLPPEILSMVKDGEILAKKGPVFATAIVAGTMAVKRTSELIPFCHTLPIEGCKIEITPKESGHLAVQCTVETNYKTGVEIEALMGTTITALTVYDMLKALSSAIIIGETRLIEKRGGKRDYRAGREKS